MSRSRFLTAWLLGGLLFLYGPIAVLVGRNPEDMDLPHDATLPALPGRRGSDVDLEPF